MNTVDVFILGTAALLRILHLEVRLLRRASGIGGLVLAVTIATKIAAVLVKRLLPVPFGARTVVYLLMGADRDAYPVRPCSLQANATGLTAGPAGRRKALVSVVGPCERYRWRHLDLVNQFLWWHIPV